MSNIILVRHGQASFLDRDGNYDKLCANGEEQSRLLGEYWARRGLVFSGAYSGPRLRQRETARIVADAYRRAGVDFPETVVMSEFDEYQAEAALRECLPQLLQANLEIRELHRAYESSKEPNQSGDGRRTFQKLFEAVIRRWAAGEVRAKGVEPWHEFCSRVERGLVQVVRDTSSSGSAVIFTSAGAIGVAVRQALHLSADDTLQLTWMSRNASFSEFLASGERFTLSAFNAHPHLNGDRLLTYR
ncbi:MAG TPA: histidine phosphatase family protein [Terriglobales bacterium]|nr:histidine phosphatase family protein [Terriglobales bacterium]